jgi:hypothetical protein
LKEGTLSMATFLQQAAPNLAGALRALTESGAWRGTASELSVVLAAAGLRHFPTAPRLSALLRNREPDLYWQGISVSFRRRPGSGERLVEIVRRRRVTVKF